MSEPTKTDKQLAESLDRTFARLEEYYPDRVLVHGIEMDHKNLSGDVSGVYRWLGYPDVQSFLAAYGYEYAPFATTGRPASDFQPMLDALAEKYKTHPKPKTLGALIFENPEYRGQLKTIQNQCQALFGMTAKRYFQQLGVIAAGRTPRQRWAPQPEVCAEAEEVPVRLEGYTEPENVTNASQFDYIIDTKGQVSILRYLGRNSVVAVPAGIEEISKALEEIGPRVFEGCPVSLVKLPASLRTLAPDSFDILCGHNTEQKLDISFGNPWLCTDGKALYTMENGEKTLSIVYDQDLKGDHWGTSGAAFTVEEGTTAIAPGVFRRLRGVKRVLLPEGLRTIGDSAFRDCMNLNSIQLPQSLTSIGDRAFEGTSIKSFSHPSGIEQIGTAAFRTGRENGEFHIHEIRLSRENPAFHIENNVLCRRTESGLWVLGCFGGATMVYLPGASQKQDRQSAKLRGQYMDCIQIGRQKTVFDFVKYDSLFPAITKPKDKILVATDRLKSAIQLAPLYRDAYLSYLQRNAEQAVRIVVEFDDLAGLTVLAELGVFTGKNIDLVVELANALEKPEIVGYMMNYKNASIGFTETDYEL